MEDDNITLNPPVRVNVFRRINSPLKAIHYSADLLHVIYHSNFAGLRIFGGQFIHTASVNLEKGTIRVQRTPPHHLQQLAYLHPTKARDSNVPDVQQLCPKRNRTALL